MRVVTFGVSLLGLLMALSFGSCVFTLITAFSTTVSFTRLGQLTN